MSEKVKRVEAAFAALAGQYKKRKKAAESAVVEWKLATASMYDVRPLRAESHGWPAGRTLRAAPKAGRDYFECGFDAAGRVVVERQYGDHGMYETFTDWSAHPVEVAHFDYDKAKPPLNLLHAYREDGRTLETYMSAVHGFDREVFRWDGAVVRAVEVYHAPRKGGKLAPLKLWHTVRADYDAGGALLRVELVSPADPGEEPETELMFERRGAKIYRKRT